MRTTFFRLTVLFVVVLTALGAGLSAQTPGSAIDLDKQRQPFALIGKDWRFHAGDNAAWSQPSFDDSSWKLLQPGAEWTAQGFAPENGLGWFRFRLLLPANQPSLVILLPRIDQSYQFFANGKLVGQVGDLPPAVPRHVIPASRVFTVPIQPRGMPQEVSFALRLWQAPEYANIHTKMLLGRPYAGESATVLRQFAMGNATILLSKGSDYTQDILIVIVGAASLLLFLLTRQNFYLWFAIYNVLLVTILPIVLLSQHFAWDYTFTLYLYILQDFAGTAALAIFLLKSLNLGEWKALSLAVLLALLAELGPIALILWKISSLWADGFYFVFSTTLQVLLIVYLVRGWRAGMVDAKLLLLPYSLGALFSTADNLGHFLIDWRVPHAGILLTREYAILTAPFRVSLSDVGSIISLLGFLSVLVYRFARTSRDQQRLTAALQTAHDVQHRLIPLEIPSLGGLHTEVVYLAAEEVGGDFCQVLPRADGSILVAVGDVSGKGLQAAMLGTFAVGALRSIADENIDPAPTLDRLNHVLMRAGHSGFTTCLCLVLTPTGDVTVANAGHLAPYLDGVEIELAPGLPLGILEDPEYGQVSFTLPAHARLTLISDGVVEARSADGQLFGFERTARASGLPASQIAAQASAHGQQDDITVVTLDWACPPVSSEPIHADSVLV